MMIYACKSVAAVDKVIVNDEMTLLIASSVSVNLLEDALFQIQTSIAALVNNSHCCLCSCPCVCYLHTIRKFVNLTFALIGMFCRCNLYQVVEAQAVKTYTSLDKQMKLFSTKYISFLPSNICHKRPGRWGRLGRRMRSIHASGAMRVAC